MDPSIRTHDALFDQWFKFGFLMAVAVIIFFVIVVWLARR